MQPRPTSGLSRLSLVLLASAALTLGACSSDSSDEDTTDGDTTGDTTDGDTTDGENTGGDNTGMGDVSTDENGVRTLVIDATAGGFGAAADDPANKWTYVDLDTDQVLDIDDTEALGNTDWDIAFKRTETRLNNGVSGPGAAMGGIVDAQMEFYDEAGEPLPAAFEAATADSEYDSLTTSLDFSSVTLVGDVVVPAIVNDGFDTEGSWWLYNPATHTVSANTAAWYVVRGSTGDSYARFHVTDIVASQAQATLEMYLQTTGDTAFSSTPVQWTTTPGLGGMTCFDFDSMQEVDCVASAADWDLKLSVSADGRDFSIWTNGALESGQEGGAFGPISDADQANYTAGGDVPNFFDDTLGGVFSDYSWYAYNLQGSHRIWPNYRTYGIDTTNAQYVLQVLRYYDEAATSGVVTIRYGQAQ